MTSLAGFRSSALLGGSLDLQVPRLDCSALVPLQTEQGVPLFGATAAAMPRGLLQP